MYFWNNQLTKYMIMHILFLFCFKESENRTYSNGQKCQWCRLHQQQEASRGGHASTRERTRGRGPEKSRHTRDAASPFTQLPGENHSTFLLIVRGESVSSLIQLIRHFVF